MHKCAGNDTLGVKRRNKRGLCLWTHLNSDRKDTKTAFLKPDLLCKIHILFFFIRISGSLLLIKTTQALKKTTSLFFGHKFMFFGL